MQATCETCGRALSAPEEAAPGAPVQVTCTCGHTQGLRVVPRPSPRGVALSVGPLPSPRGGENFEVDPWSLPPPEDGYENLVLDDGRPGAAPSAATEPVDPPPAPERARETAAERSRAHAEPAAAPADAPRIARSRLILAGAVAAVVVVGALVAAVVRSADESATRAGVRVTVTQDAPWASPPLAPMDPSYVERRRPDRAPARPVVAAPPRAHASRAVSRPPTRTASSRSAATPTSTATPAASPEPVPNAAAPEEEPAPEPAGPAPAPVAEIPLPPPPVLAAPSPPARAPAAAVRPPVLQTRSCVEEALRVPRGMEGRLPPEVALRVDVGEDGLPASVSVGGGVDPRLASALTAAVRTCRFAPGSGADGRPAAQPTTMRVRFAP